MVHRKGLGAGGGYVPSRAARSADAFGSCTFKMQFKTLYCATINIISERKRGAGGRGGGGARAPGAPRHCPALLRLADFNPKE